MSFVLVTGSTGFIGTHVVQQLLQDGHSVRATVRSLGNERKVNSLRNLHPSAKDHLQIIEAELMNRESWEKAVVGCSHVIHLASPFPDEEPVNPDDVINPAVEGTLNILRASNGSDVKRVVITSAISAITDGFVQRKTPYTETDWTDPNKAGTIAFTKSKTLSEYAAWDFVRQNDVSFELAVLNPTCVMGPALCEEPSTSMTPVMRLMENQMPMLAKLCFACVDVRDVAHAHVIALTHPSAAGRRCILFNDNFWLTDIAKICQEEFSKHGYHIEQKVAPNFLLKMASTFDKTLKMVLPSLGMKIDYDNSRMRQELEITPRDFRSTLIDMVYSMIEKGFVTKKEQYTGRVT